MMETVTSFTNVYSSTRGTFFVRIHREGKRHNLGRFLTIEEAVRARDIFLEREKNTHIQSISNGKPIINIVGNKYGRLTVTDYAGVSKTKKAHKWTCECSCGKIIQVRSGALKSGNTKSCGCLKDESVPENIKSAGEASANRVFRTYKANSKRKNLEFALSINEFKDISSKNCFYCGCDPKNFFKRHDGNGYFIYNGIDRKDNNKGYIASNSIPCCATCNRAKSNMSFEDFIDYIKNLVNFYIKTELV